MKVRIDKFGQWNAFLHLQKNLTKELHIARKECLRRWGLKAEAIAKGHLRDQDLANGFWKPLAAYTIRKKAGWGASLDTLVETGNYLESITSWADINAAYVGVRVGQKAKRGGLTMGEVARIQEFGSYAAGIPARPLWQPTYNETVNWHIQHNNVADIFLKNIRQRYN